MCTNWEPAGYVIGNNGKTSYWLQPPRLQKIHVQYLLESTVFGKRSNHLNTCDRLSLLISNWMLMLRENHFLFYSKKQRQSTVVRKYENFFISTTPRFHTSSVQWATLFYISDLQLHCKYTNEETVISKK